MNKLAKAVSAIAVLGVTSISIYPAFACSYSKLDLDYCGATPRPVPKPSAPLYKPQFEKPWTPHVPNPAPVIVTPWDSRGRTLYGPGIQWKF